MLVSSSFSPQRGGSTGGLAGHGWRWHAAPDPTPGPFHSPWLPPRRAHCQMESQPDIWGVCQTTTEPVFSFIKRGRGELPGPRGEGASHFKGLVPRTPPQPSRFALGRVSWTPLALGTELVFVCGEKTLPLLPTAGNSTCTEWSWPFSRCLTSVR